MLKRLAAALLAPLLLTSCFFAPGRFTSTLDIGRDRSFTFTYVGEVIVDDPGSALEQGMREGVAGTAVAEGAEAQDRPPPARRQEIPEARRAQIAEALSREAGYRSVEYLGDNRFRVDYSISGRLDRNFVYPTNLDAMSLVPWILVEVRTDGTARMTAIAFGDPPGTGAGPSRPDEAAQHRQGTFTLTTDADLVMHNNEQGTTPGARNSVSWRITPTTRTAPTAVVRFPG